MAQGRCSGCGFSDTSTKVKNHVLGCSEYAQLYRCDPERCLSPEAEYVRFRTQDDTFEARAERRELRIRDIFASMAQQQAAHASRWSTPKDILDD